MTANTTTPASAADSRAERSRDDLQRQLERAKEALKRAGHELQDLTYGNVCFGTDAVLRDIDNVLAELEK